MRTARLLSHARRMLACFLLLCPALAEGAKTEVASFEALRALDARLAKIAFTLTTANAGLCAERQPTPGFALHALDQYGPRERDAAKVAFGFEGAVAIETVVPSSPADRAGVRQNDTLVAVNGAVLPATATGAASSATRDAATALLAATSADAPLRLELARDGVMRPVTLPASPGCRAAFELVLDGKYVAGSDGATVRIGTRALGRYSDEQVAVLASHELAHIILRHRARLEAAGVNWGLFAEVGRNGRLFRETERDADLLGAILMRNAGYDPQLAIAFWQSGDLDGGFFRSRTHPGARERARAVADEVAQIPAGAPTPYIPPVLATRDQPLR